MKVVINHKEINLPEGVRTIADMLSCQDISESGHAVAVDNKVVPRTQWDEYVLADGAKVTVIKAVCGG